MLILALLPGLAWADERTVVPLEAVLPDAETPSEEVPVLAAVSGVRVEIVPGAESQLTLTYRLQAFADGLAVARLGAGPLTVASATLDGRSVAVPPESDGHRLLVAPLSRGSHTVVLTGVLQTPLSQLQLPLPQAPAEVLVRGTDLDVSVADGANIGDRFVLAPAASLSVAWKPAAPPPPRPDRLAAQAAVGLTLSTDGVEGAGVVNFDAVHGAVSAVRIAVPGADWAEATGSVVASSTLSGGWLTVTLVAPQTGRFSMAVSLRGPAASSLAEAPLLLPEADRREGWVSIYQGEEGFLARQPTDLTRIAPAAVPDWGQDLASGRLLSSLHYTTGRPSLRWKQSEWDALETPGTVIDSAQHEVAVVAHGRALVRSRFQVRNDRGAWLWMNLPEGGDVLAVRVAGRVVEPVRSEMRLGIPLEKSVETLTGLVSFPVEVTLLTPAPVFGRRGEATIQVPAVSAPVADVRWTLYLPPDTIARRIDGNVQLDDGAAGEELVYGRATRLADSKQDVSWEDVSWEDDQEEVSQEYWNQAYDAYKDNRFDEAADLLEQSLIANPDNTAASALQGNVQLLTGAQSAEVEAEQAERVRAMARAKSSKDTRRQEELVQSADAELRAGNVEEALSLYESAITVTDQLARLESEDDYVKKAQSAALKEKRRQAEEVSLRNQRMEESRQAQAEQEALRRMEEVPPPPPPPPVNRSAPEAGVVYQQYAEIEFEEAELKEETVMSAQTQDSAPITQDIPSGQSDQSAVQMAAGVTGGSNPNVGGASSNENSYMLDGVSITDPVTGTFSLNRDDSIDDSVSLPRRSPRPAQGAEPEWPVSTYVTPVGITASRWIVLVPPSGPALQFSRQLVPAGETLEVVVPYRRARSGRKGG